MNTSHVYTFFLGILCMFSYFLFFTQIAYICSFHSLLLNANYILFSYISYILTQAKCTFAKYCISILISALVFRLSITNAVFKLLSELILKHNSDNVTALLSSTCSSGIHIYYCPVVIKIF